MRFPSLYKVAAFVTAVLFAAAFAVHPQSGWGDSTGDGSVTDVDNGKTLNVLFIGNSYTARHNLAEVVKSMAEEGQPGLKFEYKTVIYGGRRLRDHWQLGSQNIVRASDVTEEEIRATIKGLEKLTRGPKKDKYAKYAIDRQKKFLASLESSREKWDVVVLQSYRDDIGGSESLYAQYAPKFAEAARSHGARVVLYETTPTTQNEKPLSEKPESESVMSKARSIAELADQVGAEVAPMSLAALKCQTQHPEFTLRFVNDAHLNQTMAYLTACTLYAAIFDASPQGLSVSSVTDIRYWQDKDRKKDRDNKPITRVFSSEERAALQKVAWDTHQEFVSLSKQ